jgi:methylmalonyl-CoA mutase
MTPEFGAASQLEKIDMLDFADFVAINKFDRKGSQDALRDVAKQVQRNREQWDKSTEEMPVFGTQASRFNDDGVTALYQGVLPRLAELGLKTTASKLTTVNVRFSSGRNAIVPPARSRYLAEIADSVRGYHRRVEKNALTARERQQLTEAKRMMQAAGKLSMPMSSLLNARMLLMLKPSNCCRNGLTYKRPTPVKRMSLKCVIEKFAPS